MKLTFVLILFASVISVKSADNPLIVIEDGALMGSIKTTLNGMPYLAFEGIPYAAPPTQNLRFAEPQPVTPWQGIRNATSVRDMCSQLNNGLLGNEDCLYVNVYVPKLFVEHNYPRAKLFNVIVYIHSGSFAVFTGNTAGPQYIFDYDDTVILVTFNYRLGILGFFSFADDVIPGNNGLKDQVAVMKWVQKNIVYFGGDPARVTIAGTSAGGASVHLHMLSPLSKGLFRNAISDAGAALTPWAIATNVTAKSLEVANRLGCPLISSTKMLECLRRVPFQNITSLMAQYESFVFTPIAPFGAVVEPCLTGAFLTEHPEEGLRNRMVNDVPWLIGTNENDGLFPASAILADLNAMANLTANWRMLFEPLLNLEYTIPKHLLQDTINRIKLFYFGAKEVSFNTAGNLVQMLSDRQFRNGIALSAQLQAARCKAPVYMYQFNYRGEYSTTNELTGNMVNYGVGHIDDSLYVVYDSQFQPLENKTRSDQDMTKLITLIWTTFAKRGVPSIAYNQWFPLPCNQDLLIYLNINNPYNVNIKYVKEGQIRKFWKMLPFIPLSGYTNTCPATSQLITSNGIPD